MAKHSLFQTVKKSIHGMVTTSPRTWYSQWIKRNRSDAKTREEGFSCEEKSENFINSIFLDRELYEAFKSAKGKAGELTLSARQWRQLLQLPVTSLTCATFRILLAKIPLPKNRGRER